jgi:hypothetical protein
VRFLAHGHAVFGQSRIVGVSIDVNISEAQIDLFVGKLQDRFASATRVATEAERTEPVCCFFDTNIGRLVKPMSCF